MKKSLIALAALGAFAGSAMAQSSVTLYGIVDLGLVKQNRADGSPVGVTALGAVGLTNKELNVAQATKSRLGFRGVEDLGGGYKAKFKLEHRFSPDTGAQSSTADFWDMSVVALETPVGEIGAGRDYMPGFYLQYKQDPWLNQGIAEVGGTTTYAFAGYTNPATRSARVNNAVFYSVAASGITVQAAASLKEGGLSATPTAGATGDAGAKNRYGIGVSYEAGPLYVAMAYDQSERTAGADHNLTMLGAAYDFGMIKPRLSYARADLGATTPSSYILAATVPVDTNLVKLGYAHYDADDTAGTKSNKFSIGYEHVLSKRTAVYTDVTNGKVKGLQTVTGFDVGVRHSF